MTIDFTEEEVQRFRETFRDSPMRFVRCPHSHLIDAYAQAWGPLYTVPRRGRPLVEFDCRQECTHCGDYYGPQPCRRRAHLVIPESPGSAAARRYPRQTSSAWRERASQLPRFDGLYTVNLAMGRKLVRKTIIDQCLYFTDSGEVFQFKVRHEGYGDRGSFQQQARLALEAFSNADLDNVRGLYAVYGQDLVCDMLTPANRAHRYRGPLKGERINLKLAETDLDFRKRGPKRQYAFHVFR